jgi:hypothetical protein
VNHFQKGSLLRIPQNANGSAGTVVAITVTPALASPDGMRLLDANTLVVVENIGPAGRLTKLVLNSAAKTAAGTVIDNRLDNPTSLVKIGPAYWITEGQLNQVPAFGGAGKPNLPFYVRRLPSFE